MLNLPVAPWRRMRNRPVRSGWMKITWTSFSEDAALVDVLLLLLLRLLSTPVLVSTSSSARGKFSTTHTHTDTHTSRRELVIPHRRDIR